MTMRPVVVALILVLAGAATAEVPPYMEFQARLTDAQAQPVNGTFEITFTLWNAAVDGNVVWQEVHTGMTVATGRLRVTLGSLNPLNAATIGREPLWLGVTIDGGPEMTPRQALSVVPWAFRTEVAEGVAGELHGDSIALGAITLDKLAQTCAEGQVLVMTSGAWECGEYENQGLPN